MQQQQLYLNTNSIFPSFLIFAIFLICLIYFLGGSFFRNVVSSSEDSGSISLYLFSFSDVQYVRFSLFMSGCQWL